MNQIYKLWWIDRSPEVQAGYFINQEPELVVRELKEQWYNVRLTKDYCLEFIMEERGAR